MMNCVTLDDFYREYRNLYNFYCQINDLGRKACNPPYYMSPGDCERYVYDLYEFEANLSDSENWENYDKIINDIQKLQQDFLELRIRISVRLLKNGEHIGNFWDESLDELCEQLPADSLSRDCGYTNLASAKADAEIYIQDYIMEDYGMVLKYLIKREERLGANG